MLLLTDLSGPLITIGERPTLGSRERAKRTRKHLCVPASLLCCVTSVLFFPSVPAQPACLRHPPSLALLLKKAAPAAHKQHHQSGETGLPVHLNAHHTSQTFCRAREV